MKIPLFIAPKASLFFVVSVLIILFASIGRFGIFSGDFWTVAAFFATALIFGVTARESSRLLGYHASPSKWLSGAIGTTVVFCLLVALAVCLSMFISQINSPYYDSYDSFLFTPGDVVTLDTNGQPYTVEDSGMDYVTVFLTFLVLFVSFAMSAIIGTALGAARGLLGAKSTTIIAAVAVLFTVLVMVVVAVTKVEIGAPWSGLFIFAVPVCIAAAGVLVYSLRRPYSFT